MESSTKTNAAWFIATGIALGVVAALLVYAGNPGNMGICAACFIRDSAGALGFHSNATLQYLRPELVGLVLGGFLASMFWTREFSAQTSAGTAFSNFLLGIFGMVGALVFLGCPWRAFLRLGGGDLTAIAGILGLFAGVAVGMAFKARGYERAEVVKHGKMLGILPVILAVAGFVALILGLKTGDNGALFSSTSGPASLHASVWLSLLGGAVVGVFMHKSKFCSTGAIADALSGKFSMILGVVAIILAAAAANLALGQFKLGFEGQPIAHNAWLWNFIGMALSGLCFSLSYGCPGKHLVQMGTGNLSSVSFIAGMFAGAAISHNFLLASSPKGITDAAPWALLVGFVVVLYIGFARRKAAA